MRDATWFLKIWAHQAMVACFSSPTPASSSRQPLNVGAATRQNVNAAPKLKRSHRTYREQLFRFLWRAKPWLNAGTAASAGTTKLAEPHEILAFSTKERT
jgi:hypothetical protein